MQRFRVQQTIPWQCHTEDLQATRDCRAQLSLGKEVL